MKEITIEANSRNGSGKGVARKLRMANKIPAVVYGRGDTPQALEIDYAGFHKVFHSLHGENAIINLRIDGKAADKKALIRDIQYDPVDGNIMHIDFQRISMDQKIRLNVGVRLQGTAKGVKTSGGILQWSIRELEVSCLPANIPEAIEINIESLDIHDSIKVKDLNVPNIEFLDDPEETIVNVVPPALIKEEAPAAAEGEAAATTAETKPEEPAEPEVISEKKAEERRAEKEKAKKSEK